MTLHRSTQKCVPPSDAHAVITQLPLSDDEQGTEDEREAVFALADRLVEAAAALGGEAASHCLEVFPLRPGAIAVERYGRAADPAAREERVSLDS